LERWEFWLRYRLEGETQGEFYAVLGAEGRSFTLFLDDGGFAYGGEFDALDDLRYHFETKRGDVFKIGLNEGKNESAYLLADGRRGEMIEMYCDAVSAQ